VHRLIGRNDRATGTPTLTLAPVPTNTPSVPTTTPTQARFVDNDDGTITDTKTGLIWEKKTSLAAAWTQCNGDFSAEIRTACDDPHAARNVYLWSASNTGRDGGLFTDFLSRLNKFAFAGHADWRIPTIDEFLTILKIACTGSAPCVVDSAFNNGTDSFTIADSGVYYWSSTPFASDPTKLWTVGFQDGSGGTVGMNNWIVARAVRGGSGWGIPHLVDNNDGTITDTNTGLVWEKKDDSGGIHDKDNTYTWSSSAVAADGSVFNTFLGTLNQTNFAGHHDWRLPTVSELVSILDFGMDTPAVDPLFNTICTSGCTVTTCSCTALGTYWSSTTTAYDPSFAWDVPFTSYNYNGRRFASLLSNDPKFNGNYARAVRGGS
jgi:Protein of unknown function (DUF1566)